MGGTNFLVKTFFLFNFDFLFMIHTDTEPVNEVKNYSATGKLLPDDLSAVPFTVVKGVVTMVEVRVVETLPFEFIRERHESKKARMQVHPTS